ncbi:Root meristem growth factor 9 [Spatholobus suberectus]|nr:Root meristem growth factor 9 [Spatholobus suberectus]
MAMSPNKRLLLVVFLLLCFITMTARARSLREIRDAVKKGQTDLFNPNHEGAQDSNDELDTMDYTPAKRNPPIHN